MTKISVLIPCYNASLYIGTALDSVLAQTYPNIEIIVVNDGSRDRSGEVLAAYADRGVTIIHQSNQGQCAAANRGFAASSGELIKFFDADDVMSVDHLGRQVERLGKRRDAVAMGEWARFHGDDLTEARFESLPMYRDARPIDWLVRFFGILFVPLYS